jgi:hypothetical protein
VSGFLDLSRIIPRRIKVRQTSRFRQKQPITPSKQALTAMGYLGKDEWIIAQALLRLRLPLWFFHPSGFVVDLIHR